MIEMMIFNKQLERYFRYKPPTCQAFLNGQNMWNARFSGEEALFSTYFKPLYKNSTVSPLISRDGSERISTYREDRHVAK